MVFHAQDGRVCNDGSREKKETKNKKANCHRSLIGHYCLAVECTPLFAAVHRNKGSTENDRLALRTIQDTFWLCESKGREERGEVKTEVVDTVPVLCVS